MEKIYKLLHQDLVKGEVGVEIEIEGEELKLPMDEYWRAEKDGSLRGDFPHYACEYVFQKPLPLGVVKEAILSLKKRLKDSTLNFSHRTSVHVHINVQDLTTDELLNMVYTYVLLEDLFMNYAGKERKCNRFCLRVQDAEGTLDAIQALIQGGVNCRTLRDAAYIRYAAINLASLNKYGSVEFRAMRGNLDTKVLVNWVQALMCLKRFAQKYKNVFEVYNHFTQTDSKQFAAEVLGEYLAPLEYAGYEEDILRSFSITLDIPFEAKRWERNNEEIIPEKKIQMKAKNPFERIRVDEIMAAPPLEFFNDNNAVVREMLNDVLPRAVQDPAPRRRAARIA